MTKVAGVIVASEQLSKTNNKKISTSEYDTFTVRAQHFFTMPRVIAHSPANAF